MPQTLATHPVVRVVGGLQDECDRCGAAAKLLAQLPSGGHLTFCGHHANKYAPRITATAASVVVVPQFSWQVGEHRGRHSAAE